MLDLFSTNGKVDNPDHIPFTDSKGFSYPITTGVICNFYWQPRKRQESMVIHTFRKISSVRG